MTWPYRLFTAFAVLATSTLVYSGERPANVPTPNTVAFSKDALTLTAVVAELQQQTGNALDDRRSHKDDPKLTLKPGTFWQTLDAIGAQTGVGFSAYQEGGGVALVDAPYRKLALCHSGLFRFAVKRITVTRDEETEAHHCHVTLDAAWEPRFKALYVNLDQAEVKFGKRGEKLDRQTASPVAGVSATEIDLRMKAPERAVAKIDSLKGNIRVIGVPRMLEFAFDKLKKGASLEQEGVKVQLADIELTMANKKVTRWSVVIQTDYPEGALALRELESFQQTWRDGNRVWLSWGMDPKTKRPYELDPSGLSQEEAKTGTAFSYYFLPRGDTPLPPANAKVTLRYRTPNRVVAFTVPFEFHDLRLP